MTHIVDHRSDAVSGADILELHVFKSRSGETRACVVPADLPLDRGTMEDMSEPAAQAYLDALALCEKESIPTLWIRDPMNLFPHQSRPGRTI